MLKKSSNYNGKNCNERKIEFLTVEGNLKTELGLLGWLYYLIEEDA